MGKVRPEVVKKTARDLIERYPEKFNTDFEENKKILESLSGISSKRLRNRIAGYITRLLAIAEAAEKAQTEEGETEEAEEE